MLRKVRLKFYMLSAKSYLVNWLALRNASISFYTRLLHHRKLSLWPDLWYNCSDYTLLWVEVRFFLPSKSTLLSQRQNRLQDSLLLG